MKILLVEDSEKLVGKFFGNLEVVEVLGMMEKYGGKKMTVRCKCHRCGEIFNVPLSRLKAGGAKVCARCARENLDLGHEVSKALSVDGTLISAIDGRRKVNKNSATGHTGVSRSKNGKYRAYINFRRKQYHLGEYEKIEDAVAARKIAEEEIYGDFLSWYQREFPNQWEKITRKNKDD